MNWKSKKKTLFEYMLSKEKNTCTQMSFQITFLHFPAKSKVLIENIALTSYSHKGPTANNLTDVLIQRITSITINFIITTVSLYLLKRQISSHIKGYYSGINVKYKKIHKLRSKPTVSFLLFCLSSKSWTVLSNRFLLNDKRAYVKW